MNLAAAEIRVTGEVQGVGFRYFCYTRATSLALGGWVRNEMDGAVTVYAEGDRGAIETLLSVLKVGPSHAVVSDIEVRWTPYTGKHRSFQIAH